MVHLMSPSLELVKAEGHFEISELETEAIFSAMEKGLLSRIVMTIGLVRIGSTVPDLVLVVVVVVVVVLFIACHW